MEEFRKVLRDGVNLLRKSVPSSEGESDSNKMMYDLIDKAYNLALDDVINEIINKIPN